MSWVILLIICIAAILPTELVLRRSFRPIASRQSAAPLWRESFPDSTEDEIREFLEILVDGFALSSSHRMKFRPDDQLMEIYRAVNPPKWTIGDQCEIECFALMLKK